MKVSTFEAIGIAVSIGAMALALWLIRLETTDLTVATEETADNQEAAIVVSTEGDQDAALANAVLEGSTASGRLEKLIVDDISFGTGPVVKEGDTVTVHYIGTLRNGQQFDNTYLSGEPFTFTVGEGRVIEGWDLGIVGMQAGGQRVLVVPPEFGYGEEGSGPIPGSATLVFAVELLSIQ